MQEGGSDPANYLETLLKGRIARAEILRSRARRLSLLVRISAIVMSASITIVLGVKGYFSDPIVDRNLSILAIVLSAAIAAITSYEALMDHSFMWLRRITVHSSYSLLLDELRFKSSRHTPITEAELTDLFDRIHAIKVEDLQRWVQRRQDALTASLDDKGR